MYQNILEDTAVFENSVPDVFSVCDVFNFFSMQRDSQGLTVIYSIPACYGLFLCDLCVFIQELFVAWALPTKFLFFSDKAYSPLVISLSCSLLFSVSISHSPYLCFQAIHFCSVSPCLG